MDIAIYLASNALMHFNLKSSSALFKLCHDMFSNRYKFLLPRNDKLAKALKTILFLLLKNVNVLKRLKSELTF